MEAQTRNTTAVLAEMNGQKNNAFHKPRRTTERAYVGVYREQAICTIPYGEDNYEFSFSVRKALAIQKMIENGDWAKMVKVAQDMQAKLVAKKEDVIQL